MPDFITDGAILRAGSEQLTRRSPGRIRDLGITESALRANKFEKFRKPTDQEVLMAALDTNPFVYQVCVPPGMIAGDIPIYPVYGLKTGRPKKANPEGNLLERQAIRILKDYADDCGSQKNLFARHFAIKRAPGELVQIRYERPGDKKTVYEIVHNHETVLKENRDGTWLWYRDTDDTVVVQKEDARRSWRKSFKHVRRAASPLIPLVDLLAAWQLCHKALTHQVRTGMLLGGIMIGPDDLGDSDVDWTKDWFDFIKRMAEEDTFMVPYPMKVPAGAGQDVKMLNPGMTVQEGYLALEEMLSTALARYSGMDPTLVKEGAGSATHWNGILMARQNVQSFIWPTMQQDVLEDVIAWPFRPALEASGLGYDLEDWGIDGDWQRITIGPDQLDKKIKMAENGWIAETNPMADIGIEPSELIEPGDPEFLRWEKRIQIKQNDDDRERKLPPSRERVGVGGETNGSPPDNSGDSNRGSDPQQRPNQGREAATVAVQGATVAVLDRPRPGEEAGWDDFGSW